MPEIEEKVKEALGRRVLEWYEHNPRRIYITVRAEDLKESARILFEDMGFRFSIATGTDMPGSIELTYHFSHDKTPAFFSLRVHLEDRDNPEIDSISGITRGAEWIEREIWELLGVNFRGHPGLKRLLLNDDWPEGVFPLRNKQKETGKS